MRRDELNLFSDANLHSVEQELQTPAAVVFGWHYHFAGGSARSTVLFTSNDDYLAYIELARPGDHLTLFNLDGVRDVALFRVGAIDVPDRIHVDDELWAAHLTNSDASEVIAVWRFLGPLTQQIVCGAMEFDLSEREDVESKRRALSWSARGECVFLNEAVLDQGVDGVPVTTVTPLGARRAYALIDAKRPDRVGQVPMSGPY